MKPVQRQAAPKNIIPDEQILVVKRDYLFPFGAWHGLNEVNFDEYLEIINTKKEFLPRSLMEQDPHYKQIIPYLIFNYQDRYFLMQRHKKASEARLAHKFTLGIGGHIRQEDMEQKSIFDWARREFHEEVDYQGTMTIMPLGILNDDSNTVGKVHLGFVFLIKGSSDRIKVKSELASGKLVTLDECTYVTDQMESWSQEVLSLLINKNK